MESIVTFSTIACITDGRGSRECVNSGSDGCAIGNTTGSILGRDVIGVTLSQVVDSETVFG